MPIDDVLEIIRSADPLDPTESRTWMASESARRVVADVVADVLAEDPPTPVRRRRPARRFVAAAIAATVVLTGIAAATAILGQPAPDRVKEHLAKLDAGMPADLRYNPDVERARSVAATQSGVLYLARLADGGYCLEVVTEGDRPRGAACTPEAELSARPLEVTAPIPPTDDAPILIGGRASSDRIASVKVRYANGAVSPVPFGLDRAWLVEVADGERASALADGVTITGVDESGAVVATVRVPPLRDDDPEGTAHDATQPLVLSTISDDADLTLVLGIEGRVNGDRVTALELRYPDATTTPVELGPGGTYKLLFPPARRDDFVSRPGSLVALDAGGRVIATKPVAAVSYWRARNP